MVRSPKRTRLLGEIGEALAYPLLAGGGFSEIENLNVRRMNHQDADFVAALAGTRFFISVKARNKWTNNGPPDVNPRYKLLTKERSIEDALETARSYHAELAWLAIQIDQTTYSAYFGTHRQLLLPGPTGRKLNGKGVMMTDTYTCRYMQLAKDVPHNYNYNDICNWHAGPD